MFFEGIKILNNSGHLSSGKPVLLAALRAYGKASFVTLEDETGLVNIILRPGVYERYRQAARLEPAIVVEGTLQKHDGVVNIIARRLQPVPRRDAQEGPPPPMPPGLAHDFR